MLRFLPGAFLFFAGLAGAAERAPFPPPHDTEPSKTLPLPPRDLAASLKLPSGFRATVFAHEPDVRQPIALCFDARGRLWVAENYTYSELRADPAKKLRDRIVVFEDTDHDGVHDRRTVFHDDLPSLTSVAVGLDGVWVLALPQLLFFPDANADLVPDGPPRVILDGFETAKAHHNFANGLKFGPDGWLYGRQGIQAESRVGPPGATETARVAVGANIWRVHPRDGRFEIVAHGTTNPWGLDWDEHGEAFFINTVIGHLWHLIPGARYRRMFGDDPDPHTYRLIDQHADHLHWSAGEAWQDVRKLGVTAASSQSGGGHAHTGLLIYQGDNWPAAMRGALLTINYHGRRLNRDDLVPHGSGFVGRHAPDPVHFGDPWFRGIDLATGPDGGVFVLDWSDTGECHDHDGVHRSSGRIYKITHDAPARPAIADVAALDETALVALLSHRNDYYARAARLEFQTRAARGEKLPAARGALEKLFAAPASSDALRLRALWSLRVIGAADGAFLAALLHHVSAPVRIWAVRFLAEEENARAADLAALARRESAAPVRLALASALQKLPVATRPAVAAPLLARAGDAADHNLPLLLWYGLAPLGTAAPADLLALVGDCALPVTRRLMARRLGEDIAAAPARIGELVTLAAGRDAAFQADILGGLSDALISRRSVSAPPGWPSAPAAFAADPAVQRAAQELAAIFGDASALAALGAVVLDEARDLPARRAALRLLIDRRAPGVRELAEKAFSIRGLSATAVAGLALTADPAIPDFVLARYAPLYSSEKTATVAMLASRPAWAARLLAAVVAGTVAAREITAPLARQLRAFGDPTLTAQLEKIVGPLGAEGVDKAALFRHWRERLTPEALAAADPAAGRTVYRNLCAACHTLHGEGGALGPDLTGGQRHNLDYLLFNLIDPNAVVAPEHRLATLTLKDGRVLAGMIRSRTAAAITLQTPAETITVAPAEVASLVTSEVSLMPAGLLDAVQPVQARDLIAYLMER
jgi:putative membrane-bound dehydrogenase-like protein